MVSSRVHKLLALAISLILAGCTGTASLADALQQAHVSRDAVVRLSEDRALAAVTTGSRVQVLEFSGSAAGWRTHEIASGTVGDELTVQMMTLGGETADDWNTFVYGTAPPSVSSVRLTGFTGVGGQVAQGAFAIALHEKDLAPRDIRWAFIDTSGHVVRNGQGIVTAGS